MITAADMERCVAVVAAATTLHEIHPETLWAGRGDRRTSDCRMQCMAVLADSTEMTTTQISEIFGVDRSTVSHSRMTHQDLLLTLPAYRDLYDRLLTRLGLRAPRRERRGFLASDRAFWRRRQLTPQPC